MSTYLPADVYFRYCKLAGYDALFICASDEHGTPIEIAAQKAGKDPAAFVQEFHDRQAADFAALGILFDEYYRTHSPENAKVAQEFLEAHRARGAIYEKEVELTYCENEGRFLPDRFLRGTCPFCGSEDQYGDSCEKCGKTYFASQLLNPRCAVCGKPPVKRKSKHLFFALSKYSGWLSKYLSQKPFPAEVVNYLQKWVQEGLADWDITRDGPYFGIPLPGLEGKYFYVWRRQELRRLLEGPEHRACPFHRKGHRVLPLFVLARDAQGGGLRAPPPHPGARPRHHRGREDEQEPRELHRPSRLPVALPG
jgi:methionyl-tRNA synthetase